MGEVYGSQDAGDSVLDDETVIRFQKVPTYAEFFERCLVANRPCVLPEGLVEDWHVIQSKAWEVNDGQGKAGEVDWEAIKRDYGGQVSPVVVTRINDEGQVEEDREDMTISQAIDLIQALQHESNTTLRSVYIKDWHLIKQLTFSTSTATAEPYTVPEIFADDWMNNLPPNKLDKDDFRFVYAGTRGSQTLLHRDVYTSYSWSTNIVGCKTWHLFPPRAIPSLRRFPRVSTSALIPSVESLSANAGDSSRKDFPQLEQALASMQIITQHARETVFIPSNWFHQVANVTDCISINRNWCNAVNLPSMYRSIVEELDHVEEALCDVREMLKQQQKMKKEEEVGKGEGKVEWRKKFYDLVQDVAIKDAGWAWVGFWEMVLQNLQSPATDRSKAELRPERKWVKGRLLPLVEDFEEREDAKWLDAGILDTARKCRQLLEGNPH